MTLLEQLPDDWRQILRLRYDLANLEKIQAFLDAERQDQTVFPPQKLIFRALQTTQYANVKAVILGQDPYHDEGQACGLAFSVPPDATPPPSLKNIFREYCDDLGLPLPTSSSLLPWAQRGVLLLNTVLTVRAHQPASHRRQGWEQFTDAIIAALSARRQPVLFLLWGTPAQQKLKLIDQDRHPVLKGVHPSPLSAYRGFFGSHPFSQANLLLQQRGQEPIDWQLP